MHLMHVKYKIVQLRVSEVRDVTWETEEKMKRDYRHLFEDAGK